MKVELTGPIPLKGISDFIQKTHQGFNLDRLQIEPLAFIFSQSVTDLDHPFKYVVLSSFAYRVLLRSKYLAMLDVATNHQDLTESYVGNLVGGQVLSELCSPVEWMALTYDLTPKVDVYLVALDAQGNPGTIKGFQIQIEG